MSNLLSANIDSGLMHSIGLGYQKDLQTRAAFIEVSHILVNLLELAEYLMINTITSFFLSSVYVYQLEVNVQGTP